MNASILEKILKVVQIIAAIVEYAIKAFIPDSNISE